VVLYFGTKSSNFDTNMIMIFLVCFDVMYSGEYNVFVVTLSWSKLRNLGNLVHWELCPGWRNSGDECNEHVVDRKTLAKRELHIRLYL
jgi:hypothetical protein